MRITLPALIPVSLILSLATFLSVMAWESWADTARRQRYENLEVVKATDNAIFGGPHHTQLATIAIVDAVQTPCFRNISAAQSMDDETVVGLLIDGRPYAFPLELMGQVDQHLIGFSLNQKDVLVSHCNISGCTRVFQSDQVKKEPGPRDLSIFGLQLDGKMVLSLDGVRYTQDSHEIPLEDASFEITQLCDWQSQYPDSLLYCGDAQDELLATTTAAP